MCVCVFAGMRMHIKTKQHKLVRLQTHVCVICVSLVNVDYIVLQWAHKWSKNISVV